MKRIIAVIPQYLGGGAETVTDIIVSNLPRLEYEVVLITGKLLDKCRERVDKLYSDVIIIDTPLAHYSETTTSKLAECICGLGGDILWLIGDEFYEIPMLRRVLNPDAKIIYHLHSTPFFQVRLKDSFRGDKRNSISYFKWYILKHLRNKLFKTYNRRYRCRSGRTAANVDYFVTLCEGYRQQLVEIFPEVADKFISIYNPISRMVTTTLVKRKEIIYLGRLSYADKRVDNLLRVFALVTEKHKDWILKIIGDGPELSNLQQLAYDLDLTRVEFCGYSRNPSQYLATASILCLTSEVEGWPMSLVEAMQHGVAPIAYGCSAGVCELLGDGRGVLVPTGDIDGYATSLSELMDSPKLRNRILATHPDFLHSLDIHNIMPQWLKLFV